MALQPGGVSHAQAPEPAPASSLRAYAIGPQPLLDALAQFGRISGMQVSVDADVIRGITSPGVGGSMTAEQALARLLAGTGVTYRMAGGNTAILQRAPSPQADGAIMIPEVRVDAGLERGWAPVRGYVAGVSASGTRTDTPIIETPQTVNVVTRDQMTAQGVQNTMQALRYTPGIYGEYIGSATIGDDNYILSRGFALTPYLDGLRYNCGCQGANGGIDPYLLERIDVLKGPSSVLYGQATPGGLYNMVSRRPSDQRTREVVLQTGSYGRLQGAFDLSGPIDTEGQFLYRLTGLARDSGTQFGNGTHDRRYAIAPAFTWRPDSNTRLDVMMRYQYQPDLPGFQYLPALGTVLSNPNGRISSTRYTGNSSTDRSGVEQYQAGYMFEHRFNDTWLVRQNFRYDQINSNWLFTYGFNFLDPAMTTLGRSFLAQNTRYEGFKVDNQAQATFATGPVRHTVLFGVDYRNDSSSQRVGLGAAPPLNLYRPVYMAAPPITVGPATDQNRDQTGLYVQDQIRFGRWALTIGGRQDWADAITKNRSTGARTSQRDSAFTGRVGLVYLFDNGLAPYASFSTSFEPQTGTTWSGTPFTPTTGQQYEIGIKYQPPGYNSFITLSAFDLTRQNVPTADPDHPNFSLQVGEVRIRGVELSATASLSQGLDLILSYSYLDPEITRSNSGDEGRVPANTPRHIAGAWANYTFQSGSLEGLTLGGGVRYIGPTFANNTNVWGANAGAYAGTAARVPSYTLTDAVVRYDLGKALPKAEGLSVALNVSNLFDREYVAGCTSICYYGSRRTVIASLGYRW